MMMMMMMSHHYFSKMVETHDKQHIDSSGGWTSRKILLAVLFCQIWAQNGAVLVLLGVAVVFYGFFQKGQ